MKPDAEHWSYEHYLEALENCRRSGATFADALDAIDALNFDIPGGTVKARHVGTRAYYGGELIKVPHFGSHHEIPAALAAASNRLILTWFLRKFITRDTARVVELGAGSGDLIVPLAREFTIRGTQFIACDLTDHALKCVDILSNLAGTRVETCQFNMREPTFTFTDKDSPTLIVAVGFFLCFDYATIMHFFEALLAHTKKFRLVAFDSISHQLTAYIKNHEPLPEVTQWSSNTGFLAALNDLGDRLRIRSVIPDICGKQPLYPLTALHIEPV